MTEVKTESSAMVVMTPATQPQVNKSPTKKKSQLERNFEIEFNEERKLLYDNKQPRSPDVVLKTVKSMIQKSNCRYGVSKKIIAKECREIIDRFVNEKDNRTNFNLVNCRKYFIKELDTYLQQNSSSLQQLLDDLVHERPNAPVNPPVNPPVLFLTNEPHSGNLEEQNKEKEPEFGIQVLRNQVSAKEVTICRYKRKIRELKTENEHIYKKLKQTNDVRKTEKEKFQSLKRENEELQRLQSENEELQRLQSEKDEENERLKRENEELQRLQSEKDEELQKLRNEKDECAKRLTIQGQKTTQYKRGVIDLYKFLESYGQVNKDVQRYVQTHTHCVKN